MSVGTGSVSPPSVVPTQTASLKPARKGPRQSLRYLHQGTLPKSRFRGTCPPPTPTSPEAGASWGAGSPGRHRPVGGGKRRGPARKRRARGSGGWRHRVRGARCGGKGGGEGEGRGRKGGETSPAAPLSTLRWSYSRGEAALAQQGGKWSEAKPVPSSRLRWALGEGRWLATLLPAPKTVGAPEIRFRSQGPQNSRLLPSLQFADLQGGSRRPRCGSQRQGPLML